MSSVIRGDDNFDSLESKGLGDGQTWQNVTGSRVFGVTYTNTTGRSIAVAASFGLNNFANYYIRLEIDGALITEDAGSANSEGTLRGNVFGVIPNGSTYRVYTTGGSLTGARWAELR